MKTVRIPLAVDLTDRESASYSILKADTLLINCYVEHEDGRTYVVKRPGMSTAYTYNSAGPTNGQGTAYYAGSLYAMGSNVLYRLTGSLNGSADGTAWTSSTSAPWKARVAHKTIVFNGQIFILGGLNSTGAFYLNDVWASADGVNWTQVATAAPWAGRRDFGAVVLGNTLYIMGGFGASVYNDVWSTIDGVTWKQVVGAAAWSARWGFGALPFNQGMIVMGGKDTAGTLKNDVWYSPDGSTWTQLVQNASWSARFLFGAIAFANKLWVLGGNDGATIATVYSSSDGISWTNTGSLPAARKSPCVTVYKNQMWIIGGVNNAAVTQSTVYSTSDGATFATPTAAYGGGSIEGGGAVAWRTPASVSAINAPTIWLIGGDVAGTESNQVYRATLNVAQPASYAPSTGTIVTDQWQSVTQNAGQYLIWKNTVDAWVLYAGNLQKITSPNYPQATVPGVVNLDDTAYVMDVNGVISGSSLSDPFTWPANNYITADFQSDNGIAIAKHQQYVVALKQFSIQFFYDAGRYPGCPLLPVVSANQRIGCVAAGSVVNMDNTLVFMATTGASDRYIAMLNGTTPQRISTPAVDRILSDWTPDAFCYGQNIKKNGHDFYVLTLTTTGVTLAYDFVEQRWHTMNSAGSSNTYFVGINSFTDGVSEYLQDLLVGVIYKYDPSVFQDSGSTISVSVTSSKFDGGNNNRKFCGSATVIGDRTATFTPNTATLQWSDNDGGVWLGQTVDLTQEIPRVNRLGSFYRRQFRLLHATNNPMRVEAVELEVIQE
jgi:hypothetical protein